MRPGGLPDIIPAPLDPAQATQGISVSTPDKRFFDTFMLVVGILIGLGVGMGILARNIASDSRGAHIDPLVTEQVLERIRPVARVALIGDSSIETPVGVSVAPKPVAAVMTGPQVYNTACFACHATGVGGAPTLGVPDEWAARIGQGRATLEKHVIIGYQGEAGYMPPKGGRLDLSDKEILAALDFMLEEAQ